jgi:hypothetical protein
MNNKDGNEDFGQGNAINSGSVAAGDKSIYWLITLERKRRSKHESEGRIYKCECGKSYLSQPALNNHKNTKHTALMGGNVEKRGRGRPRKYVKYFNS